MDENKLPDNINFGDGHSVRASQPFETQEYTGSKTNPRKPKPRPTRSLFMEYVKHWYVIVISIMMCFPAYMLQIFLGNLFIAKKVPAFASALLTMFLGGLTATLPFLILNIILTARKKYYAIAVQLIAMMSLGMAFYLHYKIML